MDDPDWQTISSCEEESADRLEWIWNDEPKEDSKKKSKNNFNEEYWNKWKQFRRQIEIFFNDFVRKK